MQVHDFTPPGRDFASAREECVDGRLVVVAREERGHNEDSHEAHENEHDQHLDQRKPRTMTHWRRATPQGKHRALNV